jgi:hypothetical protein
MGTVEFKKECLDIVNLLNSPAVVGTYRGKEAWTQIEKTMDEVSDGVLVLIDLRKANPLQYVFCQHAFGPLFQALKNKRWQRKYIIFQMHNFHQPGFFRGVLKYLGTELPRKESRIGFISERLYAKLVVGDEKLIDFVGKLDENEKVILNVINEVREVTVRKVVEKTNLSEEKIVDALRSLVQKYFIVGPFDESDLLPHYYSFYNYLGKE